MVGSLYSDHQNVGISHKRHGNRVFLCGGGNNRVFCVSIARTVIQTHGRRLVMPAKPVKTFFGVEVKSRQPV